MAAMTTMMVIFVFFGAGVRGQSWKCRDTGRVVSGDRVQQVNDGDYAMLAPDRSRGDLRSVKIRVQQPVKSGTLFLHGDMFMHEFVYVSRAGHFGYIYADGARRIKLENREIGVFDYTLSDFRVRIDKNATNIALTIEGVYETRQSTEISTMNGLMTVYLGQNTCWKNTGREGGNALYDVEFNGEPLDEHVVVRNRGNFLNNIVPAYHQRFESTEPIDIA